MDIESDGNDGLNLESDLMMADALGEAMSLQPSILNARATKMFTGGPAAQCGSAAQRGSARLSAAQRGSSRLSAAQRGSARLSAAQRGSAQVDFFITGGAPCRKNDGGLCPTTRRVKNKQKVNPQW